jgi:hypothetical protein
MYLLMLLAILIPMVGVAAQGVYVFYRSTLTGNISEVMTLVGGASQPYYRIDGPTGTLVNFRAVTPTYQACTGSGLAEICGVSIALFPGDNATFTFVLQSSSSKPITPELNVTTTTSSINGTFYSMLTHGCPSSCVDTSLSSGTAWVNNSLQPLTSIPASVNNQLVVWIVCQIPTNVAPGAVSLIISVGR